MTRDEYLTLLDTEPATLNQRGRIMHECDRLGLVDRTERLAVLAAVLGIDGLDSTADLVMGQAGQLVNVLQRTRDRAELPDVLAIDGQGDEPGEQISISEALARIMLMIYAAWHGNDSESKPARMGLKNLSSSARRGRLRNVRSLKLSGQLVRTRGMGCFKRRGALLVRPIRSPLARMERYSSPIQEQIGEQSMSLMEYEWYECETEWRRSTPRSGS